MTHYNLALIGFGNVGRSFARLLLRKEAELKDQLWSLFCHHNDCHRASRHRPGPQRVGTLEGAET